jgi:thiamine-phosphate pyrophosphorylase
VPGIDLSLCVILDRDVGRSRGPADLTRQVIVNGATCIQVRLKNESAREILGFSAEVLKAAAGSAVAVIVNDRLDIALAAGASGVHLGENDLPVAQARRIAGPRLIIGASAADPETARRAEADGADYVGVGPIFPTAVKPDAATVPGGTIAAIRRIISLPIVAIGGINETNLHIPLAEGADGIAVISALRQCPSPGESTSRLRRALDKAKMR